jgi:hypothetical protein
MDRKIFQYFIVLKELMNLLIFLGQDCLDITDVCGFVRIILLFYSIAQAYRKGSIKTIYGCYSYGLAFRMSRAYKYWLDQLGKLAASSFCIV